jgi:hypothetical protein
LYYKNKYLGLKNKELVGGEDPIKVVYKYFPEDDGIKFLDPLKFRERNFSDKQVIDKVKILIEKKVDIDPILKQTNFFARYNYLDSSLFKLIDFNYISKLLDYINVWGYTYFTLPHILFFK